MLIRNNLSESRSMYSPNLVEGILLGGSATNARFENWEVDYDKLKGMEFAVFQLRRSCQWLGWDL